MNHSVVFRIGFNGESYMSYQWSLRTKLLVTFFSISLLSVVIGATASHSASKVISVYRSIAKDNVPNLKSFIKLKSSQVELSVYAAALAGTNSTKAQAEKARASAQTTIHEFEEVAKEYESAPFEPGEEELWTDFKKNQWQSLANISMEIIRLSGTENHEDQKKRDQIFNSQYEAIYRSTAEKFEKLIKFQITAVDSGSKKGDEYYSNMNWMIGVVTVCGFVLALAVGTLFALFLSRELRAVVSVLTAGANEVATVVAELTSASESLSSASTQQAAAIQETAASIEEINAMVTKNAESATQSAQVSDESKVQAQDGKSEVEKVIAAMIEIQKSNQTIESETHQSHLKISEIVDMIQSIGSKTKVINDIVFQTKLLSFNASVEAARAGEHGKGFAVVAEEVGNLAQMSGNAAKEISTLLDASVTKVQDIVKQAQGKVEGLMIDANRKIDQGNAVTRECGQVLDQIVGLANQLSGMVGGISSASIEQSRGIKEITKAIQELNEATQTNVLASQQTSTSASALSGQISSLKTVSDKLTILIEGT
jgi:methyl-accepting chemotaxis protein